MTKRAISEQEKFWMGDFGAQYNDRNIGNDLIKGRKHLFRSALRTIGGITNAIEFGANIGLNIRALKRLYPEINLSAIEINKEAVDRLLEIDDLIVHQGSVLDIHAKKLYDLVFSVGVLIHINPNDLENVYQNIYFSSSRYILIAEYYSPKPTSVPYRGYENKLFKRDFAGELLDKYVDLKLIDYGFCYHRDPKVPLDDITWFLLEKV